MDNYQKLVRQAAAAILRVDLERQEGSIINGYLSLLADQTASEIRAGVANLADELDPQDERLSLSIDLSGPDGNIFVVMAQAAQLLPETERAEITARVMRCHTYTDALAEINTHFVHLVDTSGTYTFE